MNKKNRTNNFYRWMRPLTEKVPASHVDHKILAYSSQYFSSHKEKSFFFNWKISGAAVLTSVVLLVVLLNRGQTPKPASMMLTESPEMILNYNEIELMADAAKLSEADWAQINESK